MSQFPIPVALDVKRDIYIRGPQHSPKALPLPRMGIGITSAIYTQETGPKESEKMIETLKIKNTPAMESPVEGLLGLICELTTASQISARVIPIVPNNRGFRRPTRSRMNTMKIRSNC